MRNLDILTARKVEKLQESRQSRYGVLLTAVNSANTVTNAGDAQNIDLLWHGYHDDEMPMPYITVDNGNYVLEAKLDQIRKFADESVSNQIFKNEIRNVLDANSSRLRRRDKDKHAKELRERRDRNVVREYSKKGKAKILLDNIINDDSINSFAPVEYSSWYKSIEKKQSLPLNPMVSLEKVLFHDHKDTPNRCIKKAFPGLRQLARKAGVSEVGLESIPDEESAEIHLVTNYFNLRSIPNHPPEEVLYMICDSPNVPRSLRFERSNLHCSRPICVGVLDETGEPCPGDGVFAPSHAFAIPSSLESHMFLSWMTWRAPPRAEGEVSQAVSDEQQLINNNNKDLLYRLKNTDSIRFLIDLEKDPVALDLTHPALIKAWQCVRLLGDKVSLAALNATAQQFEIIGKRIMKEKRKLKKIGLRRRRSCAFKLGKANHDRLLSKATALKGVIEQWWAEYKKSFEFLSTRLIHCPIHLSEAVSAPVPPNFKDYITMPIVDDVSAGSQNVRWSDQLIPPVSEFPEVPPLMASKFMEPHLKFAFDKALFNPIRGGAMTLFKSAQEIEEDDKIRHAPHDDYFREINEEIFMNQSESFQYLRKEEEIDELRKIVNSQVDVKKLHHKMLAMKAKTIEEEGIKANCEHEFIINRDGKRIQVKVHGRKESTTKDRVTKLTDALLEKLENERSFHERGMANLAPIAKESVDDDLKEYRTTINIADMISSGGDSVFFPDYPTRHTSKDAPSLYLSQLQLVARDLEGVVRGKSLLRSALEFYQDQGADLDNHVLFQTPCTVEAVKELDVQTLQRKQEGALPFWEALQSSLCDSFGVTPCSENFIHDAVFIKVVLPSDKQFIDSDERKAVSGIPSFLAIIPPCDGSNRRGGISWARKVDEEKELGRRMDKSTFVVLPVNSELNECPCLWSSSPVVMWSEKDAIHCILEAGARPNEHQEAMQTALNTIMKHCYEKGIWGRPLKRYEVGDDTTKNSTSQSSPPIVGAHFVNMLTRNPTKDLCTMSPSLVMTLIAPSNPNFMNMNSDIVASVASLVSDYYKFEDRSPAAMEAGKGPMTRNIPAFRFSMGAKKFCPGAHANNMDHLYTYLEMDMLCDYQYTRKYLKGVKEIRKATDKTVTHITPFSMKMTYDAPTSILCSNADNTITKESTSYIDVLPVPTIWLDNDISLVQAVGHAALSQVAAGNNHQKLISTQPVIAIKVFMPPIGDPPRSPDIPEILFLCPLNSSPFMDACSSSCRDTWYVYKKLRPSTSPEKKESGDDMGEILPRFILDYTSPEQLDEDFTKDWRDELSRRRAEEGFWTLDRVMSRTFESPSDVFQWTRNQMEPWFQFASKNQGISNFSKDVMRREEVIRESIRAKVFVISQEEVHNQESLPNTLNYPMVPHVLQTYERFSSNTYSHLFQFWNNPSFRRASKRGDLVKILEDSSVFVDNFAQGAMFNPGYFLLFPDSKVSSVMSGSLFEATECTLKDGETKQVDMMLSMNSVDTMSLSFSSQDNYLVRPSRTLGPLTSTVGARGLWDDKAGRYRCEHYLRGYDPVYLCSPELTSINPKKLSKGESLPESKRDVNIQSFPSLSVNGTSVLESNDNIMMKDAVIRGGDRNLNCMGILHRMTRYLNFTNKKDGITGCILVPKSAAMKSIISIGGLVAFSSEGSTCSSLSDYTPHFFKLKRIVSGMKENRSETEKTPEEVEKAKQDDDRRNDEDEKEEHYTIDPGTDCWSWRGSIGGSRFVVQDTFQTITWVNYGHSVRCCRDLLLASAFASASTVADISDPNTASVELDCSSSEDALIVGKSVVHTVGSDVSLDGKRLYKGQVKTYTSNGVKYGTKVLCRSDALESQQQTEFGEFGDDDGNAASLPSLWIGECGHQSVGKSLDHLKFTQMARTPCTAGIFYANCQKINDEGEDWVPRKLKMGKPLPFEQQASDRSWEAGLKVAEEYLKKQLIRVSKFKDPAITATLPDSFQTAAKAFQGTMSADSEPFAIGLNPELLDVLTNLFRDRSEQNQIERDNILIDFETRADKGSGKEKEQLEDELKILKEGNEDVAPKRDSMRYIIDHWSSALNDVDTHRGKVHRSNVTAIPSVLRFGIDEDRYVSALVDSKKK
eukprot:GHVH01005055.1.p1 GENE.GHVH01005055.1~~GHVH01005055.1.p1  ORF type:complete len:2100 (+),score=292.73 GHVH01005055.1:83-6382(+)